MTFNHTHSRLFTKPLIATVLFVLLAWLTAGTLLAQESPTSAAEREVTANDVNVVARELWCPLCSGVRLDACELKACDQMKDVIAIKLAEGEDTESIKEYFVGQYGPQVLGEPPREGFNWLAWILPVVALVIGGVFLWRQMGRMMRPTQAAGSADSPSPAPHSWSAPTAETNGEDEYERKLNEELSRYG